MFPAKILLFGEYTILLNSFAFALPYDRLKGDWSYINDNPDFNPEKAIHSNQNLKDFLKYFKLMAQKQNINCFLDINKFEKDIENGLYFKSDIPIGCGLGSSGTLVAAIYKSYGKNRIANNYISELRNCLAQLESYFHGTSSGIDPLVSYLNLPVLVKTDKKPERLIFPVEKLLRDYGVFLVYSQANGKTSQLVNYFNNRYKSDIEYYSIINKQYIPLNNECVTTLAELNDTKKFFSIIPAFVGLQLILFKEMIPQNFIPFINYGLENSRFYLKLCGSGGGGYYIGFTQSLKETQSYFKEKGYYILSFTI